MDRMDRTSKLVFAGGMLFFTLLGIVLGVVGYGEFQAYRLMQSNVAGLVQLVNYNLQQGHLAMLPSAPAQPGPPEPSLGGGRGGSAPAPAPAAPTRPGP